MKKVIVIVGPTGSGKTSYSIMLAKKLNAEIINGDSVQVYKELNIGSAKIKESEKNGVLHHLFDITSAKNQYTAYDFQKAARSLIDKIDIPIIVGGTGFYIKATLYNYEFDEENNKNDFSNLSNDELYERLIKIDPKIEIDKSNQHRLIRALNQALSGNLRSEKNNKDEILYDVLTIYLDIDRALLKSRLHLRLDKMFEEGFIEEVISLRNDGIKLNMIGYREIDNYLDGKLSLEEAKEEIIKVSMRLAKKQKTWFKNQMDAVMFDPLDSSTSEKIYQKALEFLKGR